MSADAANSSLIVFSANRAPSRSGEIYVVGPSGHTIDLSNSTEYQDTNPVVSPDGRRFAFFSDRSGKWGVYEVGIDGQGLAQVAQSVTAGIRGFGPQVAGLAWQPHGGRLSVSTGRDIWIVQPGGGSVRVRSAYLDVDPWSPDGLALAAYVYAKGGTRELVLSPTGRRLWSVKRGTQGFGTWSARGLLALTSGPAKLGARLAVAVYDEAGHLRFEARLGRPGTSGYQSSWSPNGSRLALVSGRTLQVRTTTGRVLLSKHVQQKLFWLSWDGNGRVLLGGYGSCQCHVKSVDVRTGKTSRASDRFNRQTSADGKRAILTAPSGTEFEIQVAPTAGGPPQTYTHVPGCDESGAWFANAGQFQFVPNSRSIVYASICSSSTADLYSVPAAGGAVHQITSTRTNHFWPALSPDGSEIAYTSAQTWSIHGLNVGGSGERALTSPPTCDNDQSPTWSPDGATILFGRTHCNSAGTLPELYTVPANGGAVHDLGIAGLSPAWGPSRIAYVNFEPPGAPAGVYVWTANPNGTDPVAVGSGDGPAWSPTGQLAYLKNNPRHFVVGSTQRTFPFSYVSSLAWSPDGTRLVVTARKTPTAPFDVYTIKPDGTDPVQLTTNYGASGASW